ncbi:hypothetical protein ACXJJ3_10985 [Kribbella sp. WER1]
MSRNQLSRTGKHLLRWASRLTLARTSKRPPPRMSTLQRAATPALWTARLRVVQQTRRPTRQVRPRWMLPLGTLETALLRRPETTRLAGRAMEQDPRQLTVRPS